MDIPMDAGGAVGGTPVIIEQGSRELSAEVTKLDPASGVVTTNGRSAAQAVGDPGAAAAVSAFATAWSQYLDDLTGHVRALGLLAQVGSQDLAAAGGTGGTKPPPPRFPLLPGIPGLPGSTNTTWPGMPPGWHPPMLPPASTSGPR